MLACSSPIPEYPSLPLPEAAPAPLADQQDVRQAQTGDGEFYSFGLTAEEQLDMRKLLFAVLKNGDVSLPGTNASETNPKDASQMSSWTSGPTSDEFDSSDWSDATSSTDSDITAAEFSDDEFS